MGKIVNIVCKSLSEDGFGMFYLGQKEYRVSNLLPEEEAIVDMDLSKKYNNVIIKRITKKSSARIEPKCNIFDKCGGCQLLHLNYSNHKNYKIELVKSALKEFGIMKDIDEYLDSSNIYEYRNKMQVAYRYINNKLVYGFYEENSHKIIALNNCIVQSKIQNEIAHFIWELMQKYKIPAYNEEKRTGLIRFVLIKEASITKEVLVVIITNSNIFPGRNDFILEIKNKFPEIKSIIQNVNTRKTSIILGEEERILYGRGYIEDELLGLKFKISAKTFYQINKAQTIKLYSKVIELGGFEKTNIVLDAYCGVGTIGMLVAKYVKQVIGVESNKQSVINAISNAKDNKLNNINFICADATKYLLELSKDEQEIDVLIMDPPREGSTEVFLDSLIKLKPKKVIYVSCNPKTLARDLKVLLKVYSIQKLILVDMFIWTTHIESIVLLERR